MNKLSKDSLANEMRQALRGSLSIPNDSGYNAARAVFNSSVDVHPSMIAQCLDVEDVQTAVKIARNAMVPISVKGGSHDWEGRAVCEIAASWNPADAELATSIASGPKDVSERLADSSLPGGYINYLGKDESDRAFQFFGSNVPRLLSVKRKYDPTNTFGSAPGALWPRNPGKSESSRRELNSDGSSNV